VLGVESEDIDPTPLDVIRETLREAGVTEIRVWKNMVRPDYCEDCGAPLFPNTKDEIVHPEEPEFPNESSTPGGHFH
jgi:hypothetical protein